MAFDVNLKILRVAKGWSQEKLADEIGVSRQMVSRYEKGLARPDMKRMQQIADLFGKTLDALVSDNEPVLETNPENEITAPEDQNHPHPGATRTYRNLALGILALVLVGSLIAIPLISRNGQVNGDVQSIVHNYIENAPMYPLNSIDAGFIRELMQEEGQNDSDLSNEDIEQAIEKSLLEYFSIYREYGLEYSKGILYYGGEPVGRFEEYNEDTPIFWDGEGEIHILSERSDEGIIRLETPDGLLVE